MSYLWIFSSRQQLITAYPLVGQRSRDLNDHLVSVVWEHLVGFLPALSMVSALLHACKYMFPADPSRPVIVAYR